MEARIWIQLRSSVVYVRTKQPIRYVRVWRCDHFGALLSDMYRCQQAFRCLELYTANDVNFFLYFNTTQSRLSSGMSSEYIQFRILDILYESNRVCWLISLNLEHCTNMRSAVLLIWVSWKGSNLTCLWWGWYVLLALWSAYFSYR
jgi:hypothetical protein